MSKTSMTLAVQIVLIKVLLLMRVFTARVPGYSVYRALIKSFKLKQRISMYYNVVRII